MMAVLIVGGFILLAMGQYYLYRQQMHINKMVAEGLMQIKEVQNSQLMPDDLKEGIPEGSEGVMQEE